MELRQSLIAAYLVRPRSSLVITVRVLQREEGFYVSKQFQFVKLHFDVTCICKLIPIDLNPCNIHTTTAYEEDSYLQHSR